MEVLKMNRKHTLSHTHMCTHPSRLLGSIGAYGFKLGGSRPNEEVGDSLGELRHVGLIGFKARPRRIDSHAYSCRPVQ